MPSVPNTWLNDFITNLKTTGTQSDPVITVLASGHFLVVWTDSDDTGVGSPAGADIVGRIFDSQGAAVTGDILLNTRNQGDTESDPSVTALPNGGFTITYDEAGAFTDVNVQTYGFDPATNAVSFGNTADIFFDTGDVNPFGTVIAATSSSTALAAYTAANADGSETVFVRSYDPTTGALGAATSVFVGAAGAGEDISGPSIAALTNGNFAVAFVNRNNGAANDDVELRIRNNAGGAVTSITVASGLEANDVSVAAINTGHFVVAYNNLANGGDITYRVFTNAGVANGGPFTDGNGPNSQNEQAVIGLADGTFVIVWDDDTAGQIVGQRYGISGAGVFAVTGNFVVDNTGGAGISQISLAAFEDGRFAVTWSADGDIRTKILDTRDVVNSTAVYTFQQQQVGTIGADVFQTDSQADLVHGHDGNDIITDGGLSEDNQYFGDDGNDTLIVTTSIIGDSWDGGSGTDTIDWSGSGVVDGTFNLGTETATLGANTETMADFENIIATNTNDTIFGDGSNNTITALDGNDTIEGGFSTDTVNAGAGDDTITVRDGEFADNVDGGADVDTYVFDYQNQKIVISLQSGALQVLDSGNNPFGPALTVTGVENVTGGDLDNSITGNAQDNILDGGGGADLLVGLGGIDRYIIDNVGDVIDESVAGSGGDDIILSSISLNMTDAVHYKGDLEVAQLLGADDLNILGNALNNRLIGNTGANVLNGGAGADLLQGRGGNDTYVVENAADVVDETLGGSNGIDLVRSTLSFSLADAVHAKGALENLTLIGAANINGLGNDLNNVITGNTGDNSLNGGLGADTLAGGAGDDTYTVDNAGDIVDESVAGSSGVDLVRSTVSFSLADVVHAKGDIENLTLLGAADINGLGNDLANVLIGNTGDNTLNGGLGADTMRGGAGDDNYTVDNAGDIVDEGAAGSAGIDTVRSSISYSLVASATLLGSVENVTLVGAANLNALGNALDNILIGNTGINTLNGGVGADTLQGGAGNDTYAVDNVGDLVDESVAGSSGIDLVQSTVSFNLVNPAQALGSIENVNLLGAANINVFGNTLGNVLNGNTGINLIAGGLGADTITSGVGNDVILFNTALGAANVDILTDMNGSGNDTIRLDNSIFTTLAAGALSAAEFKISTTGATQLDDRIIYDNINGQLSYDSNGLAAGGSTVFAVLDPGLALTAADFFVV